MRLLDEWWQLRRQRQEEIDASIARRSDTEIFYDQESTRYGRLAVLPCRMNPDLGMDVGCRAPWDA